MDETDYRILRELQFNARISNADLAKKVGLSPSPCWNRLRNLEKKGVIDKYVTIFNQAALGMPETVIVELRIEHHDDITLKRFEEALARIPEALEAHLVTGEYDYYIKVAVAGTAAYEALLREKIFQIPGVSHTRSSFSLRCIKQSLSVQPSFPTRIRPAATSLSGYSRKL